MKRAETIHASAVLVGECGVVIRGPPGAGKSTLVAQLLDSRPGDARLVADDRVIVSHANGRVLADVPDEIAGLIEMRGIGIVRVAYVAPVVVRLVVDLAEAGACPRLPEERDASVDLAGVRVPRLILPIGSPAGAARISVAVRPGLQTLT